MNRIRLLRPDDAVVLAAVLVRNREFLQPWDPVRPEGYFTAEGQAEAIDDALRQHERGQTAPYVILDDAGAVVGRINLNNIVRIAFAEEGLHRVEAGTIPENFRSQMVLRRNGFSQFGYAPRYLSIAGAWADHLLFQKLADD